MGLMKVDAKWNKVKELTISARGDRIEKGSSSPEGMVHVKRYKEKKETA